jgi:hypothetical protein
MEGAAFFLQGDAHAEGGQWVGDVCGSSWVLVCVRGLAWCGKERGESEKMWQQDYCVQDDEKG